MLQGHHSRTFCVFWSLGFSALVSGQTPGQIDFFEKKIRPVLIENCQPCHSTQLKTAGLDLSSAEGFARGGESGLLISSTAVNKSLLLQVVNYEEATKMPPAGKLTGNHIANLKTWVEMGAPWPQIRQVSVPSNKTHTTGPSFTEEQKSFWAFQPFERPMAPDIKNRTWASSPIDQFIVAKIEGQGIRPAPPAPKTTLLRRATYDLTGLPPTESEIANFLADNSPDAFETIVERLLNSPRYGERWGRHWLDVARYADSAGNDEDVRYPYAWRYRDYVIQAFNEDVPYNQFVREQVAGDLLPPDGNEEVNRRGIVATGFLALGPKAVAQQDKIKMRYDVYDEQLDVVSKAILGLTVTCARCHDHKFDPILQRDYYSMIGIFSSTRSFANPETRPVSSLLFKPLVGAKTYEAYLAHRDSVIAKEFKIANISTKSVNKYNQDYHPRVKEYMLGARSVYVEGESLSTVGARANLDETVLSRWVTFLKPKQDNPEYLTAWHEASTDTVEAIATRYQEKFDMQTVEWARRIDLWLESYRMHFSKDKKCSFCTPDPKPSTDNFRDAFYHAVNFHKDGPFFLSEEKQDEILPAESRQTVQQLQVALERLVRDTPQEPEMACAVEDEIKPTEQHIFIRGNHHNPGEKVVRGYPLILGGETIPSEELGSGRLALARWLTRPNHPLTARVMVNRIWQWHFGRGIVTTPSNFGSTGTEPTHPSLLNYLAWRFVSTGWSVKQMHREIMLSKTYQMDSIPSAEQVAVDPSNTLFSRFNRRRMDVEEIHDGMLLMDGALDTTMGGTLQEGFGTDGENSYKRLSVNPENINRRAIYVPLRRANLPTLLNLFDFGDATTSQGRRTETNVAPQALFMMNSDFVAKRADNLASKLLQDKGTASERMKRAYLVILNRQPDKDEIDAGLSYVGNLTSEPEETFPEKEAWASFCRILLASNDFIYID
ncbi:MAG: hypothetical protein CMN58_08350 [Solibacterales bacterium]|nr:hypothetical protein [Bryobacterales bacterium]|tara:strand:+ start:17844 stop:20678 length:2835 start_codon:yes stop_codon:yes gene_type:complete